MSRLPPNLHSPSDPRAVERYLEGVARWARSSRPQRTRFSRRQRRARRKSWTMSLNLTPMIDLVFLLLFFFLVVSRFGALEGTLPTQIPARTAAVAADIPLVPLRVRLLQDAGEPGLCHATIERFNDSPIELKTLADALRKIKAMQVGFDENVPVHLVAGDEVAWDHVVNAYNAAYAAEFTRIYFAGSP